MKSYPTAACAPAGLGVSTYPAAIVPIKIATPAAPSQSRRRSDARASERGRKSLKVPVVSAGFEGELGPCVHRTLSPVLRGEGRARGQLRRVCFSTTPFTDFD